MTSEAKKRWLIGLAVALSLSLVAGLMALQRRLEQERRALEEKSLAESYPGLRGEELAQAVYLETAGLADATPEPSPRPEQRAALREEFVEVARHQRRQLERVYLAVLRRLAEGDPRYLAAVEGRSGWPYDQFEIDFAAFRQQRARYDQVLEEEERNIDALLEQIEEQLQQALSDFPLRPEAWDPRGKRIRERFQQLDQALDKRLYRRMEF